MKFLLGLLSHKVLELVLPLDPYISLTHKLLSHYIVHLTCTLHLFDLKGILFACCSSLRDSPHDPSSSLVYVVYQSDMRRVPLSIWLSLVMGDHVSVFRTAWSVYTVNGIHPPKYCLNFYIAQ